MSAVRKVTVLLPIALLEKAQRSTGENLTTTIRRGLELVAAGKAYDDLRRLKGKIPFAIDWRALRADRR